MIFCNNKLWVFYREAVAATACNGVVYRTGQVPKEILPSSWRFSEIGTLRGAVCYHSAPSPYLQPVSVAGGAP
jgi:hypothetical protein